MHKSDELKDVITVVFEKLKELGLVFRRRKVFIYSQKVKKILLYGSSAPVHLSEPILVNIPYSEKIFEESQMFQGLLDGKRKGRKYF